MNKGKKYADFMIGIFVESLYKFLKKKIGKKKAMEAILEGHQLVEKTEAEIEFNSQSVKDLQKPCH